MAEAGPQIREARWPADVSAAQQLLRSYFTWLVENPAVPQEIRSKDRRRELAGVAEVYDGVAATLLLAHSEAGLLGCAAVHLLAYREHAAEVKRLFVSRPAQGRGIGRHLLQACARWSRQRGARELLLDTLPEAMPDAVRLYRRLGFLPTPRYHQNTGCVAFFRLDLE